MPLRLAWLRIAAPVALLLTLLPAAPAAAQRVLPAIGPGARLLQSGRLLNPAGRLTTVGNLPMGAAATPDGRFYWTISAGRGDNEIRIVSVATGAVIQTVELPGASGGVAMDPTRRVAYVSGIAASGSGRADDGKVGRDADLIHVFAYDQKGKARLLRRYRVPPPASAPPVQNYRGERRPLRVGWPQDLAVSPNGGTLLVPLNLAAHAAVVNTRTGTVRYVATGRYPYGAAILPGGRTGLVSNETPGTVSVIDLRTARKLRDIPVSYPLGHPTDIALDPVAPRAYVALSNADGVAVIDTRRMRVLRVLSVRRPEGVGAYPVDVAVTPDGARLLVAEAGTEAVSVFRLPGRSGRAGEWARIGLIPTASYPSDVEAVTATGAACAATARPARSRARPRTCIKLLWLSAKGFGAGPNPYGPNPYRNDPGNYDEYVTTSVRGRVGVLDVPTAAAQRLMTTRALAQIRPINPQLAPPDTPLHADGPIQHVIYIVKQNRTYDQVLGDDPRGDGEPDLTLFGKAITPNAHALVRRFPLLDRVFVNGEASADSHQWTTAATISPYAQRNWPQQYAGRGRPDDFYNYAVSWPEGGFLFDAMVRAGIPWVNLGEGRSGVLDQRDPDRPAAFDPLVRAKAAASDLGSPPGCFPNNLGIVLGEPEAVRKPVWDSSPPPGASLQSVSRFDCFKRRMEEWQATGTTPRFIYMVLPSDHTRGQLSGGRTPSAMVAENDFALGQVVDLVSRSPIWGRTAIFVIEDDAQNGADHVDAHRMPAYVISPYARRGAVVHQRYDTASVIRSIGLILGLAPLNLMDALATPMYAAFQPTPDNAEPYDAIVPDVDMLEINP